MSGEPNITEAVERLKRVFANPWPVLETGSQTAADVHAVLAERERLRAALQAFAEPHFMGDNYVKFHPRLLTAARDALREPDQ